MSRFKDPIQRRNFLGTLLASASVGVAGLALPLQLGAAEERALPAPGGSGVRVMAWQNQRETQTGL
jgi:hypothetical protein